MLAIQIKGIKAFMAKLLNTEIFDVFLLEEAQIQTANTFIIDGHLNRDFYTKEELEESNLVSCDLSPWKDMRSICFQLIKGKRVPLLLKLTFVYNPQDARTLLEESGGKEFVPLLKSLVLNIKYDQKGLLLTTGTSFTTFLMDKTPDLIWDQAFRCFLNNAEIDFEEL